MAGYIGTKAVNLSTTGADINGDANVDGTLDVLGAFTSLGIDDNATATAVTIDASGDVGIGTTSVDYQAAGRTVLQVEDTNALLNLTDGTSAFYIHQKGGTAGVDLINTANSYVRVSTNNVERMRIDSSGKVGIGTAAPAEPLHIRTTTADANLQVEAVGAGLNARLSLYGADDGASQIRFGDVASINVGTLTYLHSVNALQFNVAQAERMRIDASGNVGIGTAAPAFASGRGLVVHNPDAAADTRVRLTNAANGTGLFDGSEITLSADGSTSFIGWEAQPMKFFTSATERMRIDASGDMLVGVTSTGGVIGGTINGAYITRLGNLSGSVASSEALALNRTGTNGGIAQFRKDGTQVGTISVTGSATTYNTTSDYRLKDNVTPIQGAADIVKAMRPATYTFKADGSWADGFIAHELQELHPIAVTGSKDAMRDEEYEVTPAVEATYDNEGVELTPAEDAVIGTRSVPDYQGVDYSKLTPILTAALQEALNKIDELTARIEALEAV